jgi:hypothetical protein
MTQGSMIDSLGDEIAMFRATVRRFLHEELVSCGGKLQDDAAW